MCISRRRCDGGAAFSFEVPQSWISHGTSQGSFTIGGVGRATAHVTQPVMVVTLLHANADEQMTVRTYGHENGASRFHIKKVT